MNNYDAAKILGLSGELTPRIIKTTYINLLKKYHPDINPAGLTMSKMINSAYEILQDFNGDINDKKAQPEYGEELNTALNAIYNLAGLRIEICGSWLWVSGKTKDNKEVLKNAGFKYAAKKKAWYFRPAGFKSFSKGKYSLNDIRDKYGSAQPNYNPRQAIA